MMGYVSGAVLATLFLAFLLALVARARKERFWASIAKDLAELLAGDVFFYIYSDGGLAKLQRWQDGLRATGVTADRKVLEREVFFLFYYSAVCAVARRAPGRALRREFIEAADGQMLEFVSSTVGGSPEQVWRDYCDRIADFRLAEQRALSEDRRWRSPAVAFGCAAVAGFPILGRGRLPLEKMSDKEFGEAKAVTSPLIGMLAEEFLKIAIDVEGQLPLVVNAIPTMRRNMAMSRAGTIPRLILG